MSGLLADVHASRTALADADRRLTDCNAAAAKQKRLAAELRERAGRVRKMLLEERVAAVSGGAPASTNSQDLIDSEIDADAADLAAEQLARRAADAATALELARKAYDRTVCAFVQACEADAIGEIEAALDTLSSACAQAIAAADLSKEHGQLRGSYNFPITDWFGAGGQLVYELRKIRWPRWPTELGPREFACQYNREMVTNHPGVDAARASIQAQIDDRVA
jgi:hypothetical protein